MIAIVIPYYRISFFEETLESLANQVDKRFKVYIGNDASPDDPSNLLLKYNDHFNFEYYKFDENLGRISLTKQWERCIGLIEDEEWIMVLGDDDVLADNVVKDFYANLEKINENGINVVRFATKEINEKENSISQLYKHPEFENPLDFLIRKLKWQTRSSLSEYIFRKEAFLKYKFHSYPSAFYSDDKAWIDFSEDKPIFTINTSAISIRISDQSISGKAKISDQLKAEYLYVKGFYENKLAYFSLKDKLYILKRMEYFIYSKYETGRMSKLILYINYWKSFNVFELLKYHKRLINRFFNK
ncbi:glycosyltransferase [Flavobacterium sp. YJ01]|uniref:glycosyltransferase family 2 protein n=1 Tax=unclassified Flavobacterium TaxID=196869 RepID=UPI0023E353DE|nr:glycosyltransferase [Flavobacterium sp. YJ01]WET01228.1 glycosyltransferase [Flavobacterium sp. YJ01]